MKKEMTSQEEVVETINDTTEVFENVGDNYPTIMSVTDYDAMRLLEHAYNYVTKKFARYEIDPKYKRFAYQVKMYKSYCYVFIAYVKQRNGFNGSVVSHFKCFSKEDLENGNTKSDRNE